MISPSRRSTLWAWHVVLFGLHIAYNSDATRCKRSNFFTVCVCVCVRACVCCLVVCRVPLCLFPELTLTSSRSLSETKYSLIIQTTPSLSPSLSLSLSLTHTHTHTPNLFKSPCIWISLKGVCSFCLVLSFIRSHTLGWNQKRGRRLLGVGGCSIYDRCSSLNLEVRRVIEFQFKASQRIPTWLFLPNKASYLNVIIMWLDMDPHNLDPNVHLPFTRKMKAFSSISSTLDCSFPFNVADCFPKYNCCYHMTLHMHNTSSMKYSWAYSVPKLHGVTRNSGGMLGNGAEERNQVALQNQVSWATADDIKGKEEKCVCECVYRRTGGAVRCVFD